jgi:hypothetical protein
MELHSKSISVTIKRQPLTANDLVGNNCKDAGRVHFGRNDRSRKYCLKKNEDWSNYILTQRGKESLKVRCESLQIRLKR